MVISFEEKDRAAIEARGMTVIQVKQVMYKLIDVWFSACEVIFEVINNLPKDQKENLIKMISKGK